MEFTVTIMERARDTPIWVSHAEEQWAMEQARMNKFCYVANPSPYVKHVLESVFGPLDWDIPYV